MKYNHFEIKVDPANYVTWEDNPGSGFQPADIYVDGKFLVDLVREIEERLFAEERHKDLDVPPGNYLSLNPEMTFLPSLNLLGEGYPEQVYVMEPGDSHWGKSVLLGCTCGVTECWFLVAKITVTDTTVEWSHFNQYYLEDEYDLGPFIFERGQYESQLAGAQTGGRGHTP